MNSAYILPKTTLDGLRIRGQWHATAIPGDPLERWFLLVDHSDDDSIAEVCKGDGVMALPDVLSRTPVGLAVASAASRATADVGAVDATDTVADLLEKLRPAWPMAKPRW